MKKNRKKKPSILRAVTPESIASLAGGIADDFNNILTTVMGACSLIDRDDSVNGELLQCVALIRASAEHAADLSDRLARVGTRTQGNVHFVNEAPDSGSAAVSVRDKMAIDDIVSAKKHPGGASS